MLTMIVLIVACMPLFTVNCIGGHDIAYHLLRIEALKEGILSGRPFLRINMLFFGGMGYASSLFYPDFLLYIPALLRVLGVGIDQSYHLFVAFCILMGFASSFFCARHISGSDYAAFITAVIFTLYQYHIYDIYTRSAVGEFTAVIFVPFVIAGLYDLMHEELSDPRFLFIGMAGVLLCHTITLVICLILCFLAVILNIKNLMRKPSVFIKLLLTAGLVLGVTAFYWMPVIEMMSTGAFSRDFFFDTSYEAVKVWELLYNDYNRMGIAIFLLLLPALVVKQRNRFADFCAVTGIITAICATGLFPWERFEKLLGFMQFPWRVFVITGPLLAFAEGLYLHRFATEIGGDEGEESGPARTVIIVIAAIMLVSAVGNLEKNTEEYYSYSDDYFDHAPFTAEVIGGEWLPEKASDRDALLLQADKAVSDKGEEVGFKRVANEIMAEGIPDDTEYIDVPFIYYKGYAAKDAQTGAVLSVSDEGGNGCVRVYTSGAEEVRVYYKGTMIQHMADIISVGCITGILVYIILTIVKRKNTGVKTDENGEGAGAAV